MNASSVRTRYRRPQPPGAIVYLIAASVLGAMFLGVGVYGLRKGTGRVWARALFGTSLVYLVGVFAALVLDA